MFKERHTIADKLFYGIIVLLVIGLGGLGSFISYQRIDSIRIKNEKEVAATVNFLEKVLPASAVKLDAGKMRKDIESTLSDQLRVVEIFDKDGERTYVYERGLPKGSGELRYDRKFERDLVFNGSTVGRFTAYFSMNEPLRQFKIREMLRLILMISAAGLILGGGLYFLVRKIIIKPIEHSLSFSESLAKGDYSKRIDAGTGDEMGMLQRSLNKMADALEDSMEELKASFYQAEGARQEALQASRLKSEFLASMSHEIRTPINAIVGFSDLLLEDEPSEERRESLRTIKKSAQILLDNINDILDFSKLEAGKLTLVKSEFLLADLVDEITPIVRLRLHGKNVTFSSYISNDLSLPVICDRVRLRQVLLNVLINAAKFTAAGRIILEVSKEGDDRILFKVSDTGIGIPKDAQKKVFEPFIQVDGTVTREHGGTGLGLAIAKRLIEMMGGDIWIDSGPGEGTVVGFTISGQGRGKVLPST